VYYTKKADALYAIRLLDADEVLPGTVTVPADRTVRTVTCLSTGETPAFTQDAAGVHITLSGALSGKEYPAVAFRFD
jgi:hypothetical protein